MRKLDFDDGNGCDNDKCDDDDGSLWIMMMMMDHGS